MPELAGEASADARAHAAGCAACAALLDGHKALTRGLRSLASQQERIKAPGRVEARLLAAFRGEAGLASPAPTRRWWTPLATWGAAAALVAAAVLVFIVRERPLQKPQDLAVASELAGTDWTAEAAAGGLPGAEDEFIPLPNARRLAPNEEVNMVRVEMPRSAMIALGFTVPAERAEERVQADVVLGSDGLARAVRFLEE